LDLAADVGNVVIVGLRAGLACVGRGRSGLGRIKALVALGRTCRTAVFHFVFQDMLFAKHGFLLGLPTKSFVGLGNILHPTGKLVKWYILEIENAVSDGVPGAQFSLAV